MFYGCYDIFYKWRTYSSYFTVYEGDFVGIYSREGKCIIPTERHYVGAMVLKAANHEKFFINVLRNGGFVGLCDMQGKEVISPIYPLLYTEGATPLKAVEVANIYGYEDKFCIEVTKTNKEHIYFDLDGNPANDKNNISQSTKYDYTNQSQLYQAYHKRTTTNTPTNGTSSTASSSTNTPSSGNNSENKTTTVVVEHHRDPVPVQQWQACWACGGMGTMGCDKCGGGGTKYIGDRLHRCSRCNGRGIIPCNVCYGNKGQYVTVYQ